MSIEYSRELDAPLGDAAGNVQSTYAVVICAAHPELNLHSAHLLGGVDGCSPIYFTCELAAMRLKKLLTDCGFIGKDGTPLSQRINRTNRLSNTRMTCPSRGADSMADSDKLGFMPDAFEALLVPANMTKRYPQFRFMLINPSLVEMCGAWCSDGDAHMLYRQLYVPQW
jgi:hypothetical protein